MPNTHIGFKLDTRFENASIYDIYIYIYIHISELLQQHKRIGALLKSVNTGSGNGVLADGTKPCNDMTDFRRPYKI